GYSLARVRRLVAIGEYQLQSGEVEGEIGPKIYRVEIPDWQRRAPSEVAHTPASVRQIRRHSYQHQQRNISGTAARILQPFANVQPNNVEHYRGRQQSQRGPKKIVGIGGQGRIFRPADEY